jgi:ribonucleoside-triphosphate reductase
MDISEDQRYPDEERAHEGEFDAQLSFPDPFAHGPQPIRAIVKRDGREVPFDKANIAETILKAAASIGDADRDRAESLASGVALYLMKRLNGSPPTAEQVSEAIEKVLIEMGHARVALAYARYRDRRDRIRKLRSGDTRTIISELEDARRESLAAAYRAGDGLYIRTSAETLDSWNRERIVDALTRETGLEQAVANIIAFEVEQQILSAGITTLTTPLVRELVDAKLAEHGLEDHRRRHMRLGVPLYDAEQIIAGMDGGETGADPSRTDLLLAERVKKEYALSRVFSLEVADAHMMGALHLHHLGRIDRLYGARHSPVYVQRFGSDGSGEKKRSRRPRSAEGLIHQIGLRNRQLSRHFTQFNVWDAINVYFAPYLHGADKRLLSQVAYALVMDCARNDGASSSQPATVFHLRWDIPQRLREQEAIGPGGAYTGRSYYDYRHTAKNLAWAIVEACRDCGARPAFAVPQVVVDVTKRFFRSQGYESFLRHASELIATGSVQFRLRRDPEPSDYGRELPLWAPTLAVGQMVSLNLPRAALAAGSVAALNAELERLVQLCVEAHKQRHRFLLRLAALGDAGPLAAIVAEQEGRPYLDLDGATYYCGIAGLNECVRHLCGAELHESSEARALAEGIVRRLAERCRHYGDEAGLRVVLAETYDTEVTQRFAHLDGVQFGELAANLISSVDGRQEVEYTGGAQLAPAAEVSPIERVRMEGALHRWTVAQALASVRVPDADTSRIAIANFIKKAFRQTEAAGVVVLK